MDERLSKIILISLIVGISGISYLLYSIYSNATIAALHERYDLVIPAHVTILPAATSGALKNCTANEVWSTDLQSIDFGSVAPNSTTDLCCLKLMNVGLPDDTRSHLSTDLNSPGVHLYMAESSDNFGQTRVDLTNLRSKGYTFQVPASRNFSKNRFFAVYVEPGTVPSDIYFSITVSYSYCND